MERGPNNVVSLVPQSLDRFGLRGEESHFMSLVLEGFEHHLRGTRGLMDSSTENAMGQIKRFTSFVQRPIWEWREADFDAFMGGKKKEKNISRATEAMYCTYLRMIQRWLLSNTVLKARIEVTFGAEIQEWITDENSIPLRAKNGKRKTETYSLNPDEVGALLKAFDTEIEKAFRMGSKTAYPLARDKVVTIFLYCYALRINELIQLTTAQFQSSSRRRQFKKYASVSVIGKGGKVGSALCLQLEAVPVFEWYEKYIRPKFSLGQSNLYFQNERGGPLSEESYRRTLKKISRVAGIEKNVTSHIFRRTYATTYMSISGLESVSRQLRHSNMATTCESYYRPDPAMAGQEVANIIAIVDKRVQEGIKENEN